jgi:metal-sulfur cluster biosynthetic enzyme
VPVATEDDVREALNMIEDPELMMGIVDLGLVYDIELEAPRIKVVYTLTSMGCPVGPWIAEQVEETLKGLDGIEEVQADLTFTPAWTPERMSEDAKFALGF